MILVCGEALIDVFAEQETASGLVLDARVGGSPFNVAVGLARMGQSVAIFGGLSQGFLGDRLRKALVVEGVDVGFCPIVDAPTTLSLVGLLADGSASYAFYGNACADRLVRGDDLPDLDDSFTALHFGSYTTVVEPVASAQRLLVERERHQRLIAYDPNLRLNVDPDLGRWTATMAWMAARVHIIKVSSEDLHAAYAGVPHHEVAQSWLALGCRLVVVTRGGSGAIAFTETEVVEVESPRVDVVDTVGAGDTFQAALLTWLSERGMLSVPAVESLDAQQLRFALEFASGAASITCTRRGADLPRRKELGNG
ncbi:MAG: carbohydrate kinase [Burkholderiales bacterium]|nr:carbohydrate kinase [Burkholderiales bacterium]